MTTYKYDIAISFAGEDRTIASDIANRLEMEQVQVFYDNFEKANLWGKDLYEYLADVYANHAQFCIMILSDSYSKKLWTNHERRSAQARAFKERAEYILPIRLDDTAIPGINETIGYIDLRNTSVDDLVNLILIKLGRKTIEGSSCESQTSLIQKSESSFNVPAKCQTFPDIESNIIPRDNIIDLIRTMLTSQTPVVFIEGDDQIGKTTFMVQFALRDPQHSISSFIDPASKWTYNPDFIRTDIYNQIIAALGGSVETSNDGPVEYESKIYELHQRAFRLKQTYYFIIDGLDSIPVEDAQIRTNILSILPIGLKHFRFLISGASLEIIGHKLVKNIDSRKYPLHGFTLDEAKKYFTGCECTEQQVEELYKITKKPGYLAIIKRMIKNKQIDPSNLEDITDQLSSLFDIDWRQITHNDESQSILLSLIAYDKKINSVDDLARISAHDKLLIEEKLVRLTFLKVDADLGISFISDAFKKYVTNKLKSKKDEATNLIIKDLFSCPSSNNSMAFLPVFLKESGNNTQLIQYLSSEYFGEMVKCCQSLVPIMKTAELGVNAAGYLRNDGELFRFGLQRTIISQLDDAAIWRAEIEANMAMGDFETALALAQSTSTKEDRLHAFAVIAKAKREQGLTENEELSDLIRQLHKEVDPSAIGKRAYEIAEELFFSHPELAIDFAERGSLSKDDPRSLDIALSKISLAALGESLGKKDQEIGNDSITSKIQNPGIKRFMESASIILGNYSASKVVNEISDFENKRDSIFILKQWLIANKGRSDASEVIEYILDLIITTSEYSPNATDFKDIAAPLQYLRDKDTVAKLISRFDSQKGIVERSGPTEDYVKLEITLATASFLHDKGNSINRFVESYFYVMKLDDVVTKAACLAYLYSRIKSVDNELILEAEENLHTLLPLEIDECIEKIISTTAYQYNATKSILRSLAKCDSTMALNIVKKLNTEPTRDKCYFSIISAMVAMPIKDLDVKLLLNIKDKIHNIDIKDNAIVKIIEGLLSFSKHNSNVLNTENEISVMIASIEDIEGRCKLACLAYNSIADKDDVCFVAQRAQLIELLTNSLDSITIPWVKINTGYKIASTIAKSNMEIAQQIISKINDYKKDVFLGSQSTAISYVSTVYLALRAFSGLIPKNIYSQDDIDNIFTLIEQVNSVTDQVRLYSVLTLYFHKYKVSQWSERIVYEKIRLLLDSISGNELYRLTVNIGPALYCANATLADSIIKRLPVGYQDDAYFEICSYLLKKTSFIDPFEDSSGFVYKCEFMDYLKICSLLDKFDCDHFIYILIDDITTSIKKQKNEFTRQQKEEIARQLLVVINAKLPNPRFINHNGYKIISEASVGRISFKSDWAFLVSEANKIPNTADRCLILAVVYECMPPKSRGKYEYIIKEAREMIDQIPSVYDQVSRLETLADSLKEVDSTLSRECLRHGMAATLKCNDPDVINTQKRIVDLASKIDPSIASSLTKIYDDDPGRISESVSLKGHLKLIEMKTDLINDANAKENMDVTELERLPSATWRALGSLNAGMSSPIKIEKVRELVKIASGMSMDMAYPVLCYSIQSIVKKYSKTDQATTIIRPTFDAIILASKLCRTMSSRAVDAHSNALKVASKHTSESLLIKSGERQKAIAFLRNWLSDNLGDYLKLCDPYFGVDDMEILTYVRSINPSCKVFIVTSRQHQDKEYGKCDLSDKYLMHWRLNISENAPPDTEIIVVGTHSNGQLPIHDRWIVTDRSGIRIGTSINSLGKTRDSEIGILSTDEATNREIEINEYISRDKKEHNGDKLKYSIFTL